MEALNCTYDDYQKAVGFSGLGTMARILPWSREFFKIENGGMRLPSVHRSILASRPLDQFVTNEFEKYSDPHTRLFGENTFTITGALDNYRVGHVERYCGGQTGGGEEMARLAAMIAVLGTLFACSSQIATPPWDKSPDFNDCWNMFPPGPEFQRRVEEYMGTTDRNVTVLGCLPEYPLNEAACKRFKEIGPGEWPDPVMKWCEKYFGVTLEKGAP